MLTLAGKPLAVPVLQGGMGVGVSLGGLAGAVAACGGMGCGLHRRHQATANPTLPATLAQRISVR